jgi:hypothetical protein
MASTPDLSADKEAGTAGFPHGFNNQYPSDHLLSSKQTTRTREQYTTDIGLQGSKQRRGCMPTDPRKRKWLFIGVPVALVVIAAIIIGVLVGIDQHNKPKSGSGSSAGSGAGTGGGGSPRPTNTGTPGLDNTSNNPYVTTGSGQTGGKAMTDLGVEFDFRNDFGGEWSQNPEDPYSVSISIAQSTRADKAIGFWTGSVFHTYITGRMGLG